MCLSPLIAVFRTRHLVVNVIEKVPAWHSGCIKRRLECLLVVLEFLDFVDISRRYTILPMKGPCRIPVAVSRIFGSDPVDCSPTYRKPVKLAGPDSSRCCRTSASRSPPTADPTTP